MGGGVKRWGARGGGEGGGGGNIFCGRDSDWNSKLRNI